MSSSVRCLNFLNRLTKSVTRFGFLTSALSLNFLFSTSNSARQSASPPPGVQVQCSRRTGSPIRSHRDCIRAGKRGRVWRFFGLFQFSHHVRYIGGVHRRHVRQIVHCHDHGKIFFVLFFAVAIFSDRCGRGPGPTLSWSRSVDSRCSYTLRYRSRCK